MKKGITPVIAIVLLLMITIAMVGFAWVWFTRISSGITTTVENQSQQQVRSLGQTVRIESATSGSIVIRNSGTQTIPSGQIKILIDGTDSGCSVGSLNPGGTYTCTATCTSGQTILVTAPGNSDTTPCS